MPKKNVANDDEDRPRRRRQAPESTPSNSGSAPVDDSGLFDRNSGLQRSQETGEVINPSHFKSRLEWQEYYAALPQSFKQNYRGMRGANEQNRNNYLSRGGDYRDLGITDEKEHGRAANRRMAMHNLDKSYSYDFERGVKYNVATSDDATYMKPVPIEPWEYQEKAEIDKYGATAEGYQRRLQDSTRNTLQSWATRNQANDPNTGKLHRGPDGRLRALNSRNEYVYFDEFGRALNDPNVFYDQGNWDQVKGEPANTVTNPGNPTTATIPGLPTSGSVLSSSLLPTAPKPIHPTMPNPLTTAPLSAPSVGLGGAFGVNNSMGLNRQMPRQMPRQPTSITMDTAPQTMPGQKPLNPFRQRNTRLNTLGLA